MTYRHTQIGYTLIAVLGVVICINIGRVLLSGPARHSILVLVITNLVLVILFICIIVFSSLTIEIRDGFLEWRFGPGIIRKKVPLSDIIRATPIKTTLLQGWGIHRTSGGWLYNVAGFQAVEFELKDGKRFRLGTDEPEELVRAVSIQIGP